MKIRAIKHKCKGFITALVFTVLAFSIGCGSGSSPNAALAIQVSVSISPGNQNIQTNAPLQFAASVSGTSNAAVSWQVNGIAGGGAGTGTISGSGLYTAPASVPTPNTVTITAVSNADATKSASVVLTIAPAITVSVSPTSPSVRTLYTQQFIATVTNTSNVAVTWSVGGGSSQGTISSAGLYSAPVSVPSPATATITATSVADSSKSGSTTVTITAPPVPTGTWSYVGPLGANGGALTVVPDNLNNQTLYAATQWRGVYKSVDQGNTWSLMFDNSLGKGTSPDSVYVGTASDSLYVVTPEGTSDGQVFNSSDGGKTFTAHAFPSGITSSNIQPSFAIDPHDDATVYMLETNLYRSHDYGSTWTQLTTPPQVANDGVAYSPIAVSGVNPNILFVGTTAGLAISTDGGTAWHLQTAGFDATFLRITQIVPDPKNNQRYLIRCAYSGTGVPPLEVHYFQSTDTGSTWSRVAIDGDPYGTLATTQTSPYLLLVNKFGLQESSDGGATFKTISPSTDAFGQSAAIIPSLTNVIFYQGLNDLHRSIDGGSTWTVAQTGILAQTTQHIEASATNAYVNNLVGRFWSSADSGQTWTSRVDAYSPGVWDFDVDPVNAMHLIALFTPPPFGDSIVAAGTSLNGGTTWDSQALPSNLTNTFAPGHPNDLRFGASGTNLAYACGSAGVARFDLTGKSWTTINNGLPTGGTCKAIGVDRKTAGTVYAAMGTGLYKSTDGGNNWHVTALTWTNTGLNSSDDSIAIDPTNSNTLYVGGTFSDGTPVMKSIDGGTTWTSLRPAGEVALDPLQPSTVYVLNNASIGVSYDAGITWGFVAFPSSLLVVADFAVVPGTGVLYVSTAGGDVLRFTPH